MAQLERLSPCLLLLTIQVEGSWSRGRKLVARLEHSDRRISGAMLELLARK